MGNSTTNYFLKCSPDSKYVVKKLLSAPFSSDHQFKSGKPNFSGFSQDYAFGANGPIAKLLFLDPHGFFFFLANMNFCIKLPAFYFFLSAQNSHTSQLEKFLEIFMFFRLNGDPHRDKCEMLIPC